METEDEAAVLKDTVFSVNLVLTGRRKKEG